MVPGRQSDWVGQRSFCRVCHGSVEASPGCPAADEVLADHNGAASVLRRRRRLTFLFPDHYTRPRRSFTIRRAGRSARTGGGSHSEGRQASPRREAPARGVHGREAGPQHGEIRRRLVTGLHGTGGWRQRQPHSGRREGRGAEPALLARGHQPGRADRVHAVGEAAATRKGKAVAGYAHARGSCTRGPHRQPALWLLAGRAAEVLRAVVLGRPRARAARYWDSRAGGAGVAPWHGRGACRRIPERATAWRKTAPPPPALKQGAVPVTVGETGSK